ncbi:MAG: gamma-glutamylcyclotransferase [Myxococcales bacterium]|nr:gamma-glutamylcyclotransferase [Myxococcales bacterium]
MPSMVLFVYGTLRRLAGHPMHASLRAVASFMGEGRIRGRLYLIDRYPGLVLDPTADWVVGELYEVRDLAGLAVLDAYEGASPEDPQPHEFRRVRRPVEQLDGQRCLAWIYEYGWPTEGRVRIPSGDFLRHER